MSVCFRGLLKDQLPQPPRKMPCPKPSPSLTFLLLSWSLGFLVCISYSGLCLASLPPNQPFEKIHHSLPFLSSNLHPSLHPYSPTPGLSWTTALLCWLPLSFWHLPAFSLASPCQPVLLKQKAYPLFLIAISAGTAWLGARPAPRTQLAQPASPSRSCWDGDGWLLFK